MDEDFLRIYSNELDYLRRMSGEFAKEFPTVARRLNLDEFECQDPWVERLIEGTAFLTARVQRQLHGGMPRLAQSLVDIAAPYASAPCFRLTFLRGHEHHARGGPFVTSHFGRYRSRTLSWHREASRQRTSLWSEVSKPGFN